MVFDNIVVKRIAVHEVFQRIDRALMPPAFAAALETLDTEGMDVFRQRITEALSSKALEMAIAKHDAGSFLVTAEALEISSDDEFLQKSQIVATTLAEAQTLRNIPGGMLMVFDGTVTAQNVPFVAVLKAEMQSGFRKDRPQDRMQFFKDLFLTPTTRLYKVGIMLHNDVTVAREVGWGAFVFDSNISPSNREAAAIYFYDTFLGCQLRSDGPYETAKFFDLTKEYVRGSSLDPDLKRNVMDSLNVFIRDVQTPTFTAHEFAENYLPRDIRDDYDGFMTAKRFTPNAVARDISAMGPRLRRRRYRFGAGVEVSVAADAMGKVEFKTIAGPEVDGFAQSWTQVTIKESMTGEG